jgi:dihydrofolate reductase
MRRIIVATFISLDGVMQAPGGPREDPTGGFTLGGWTAPHFDDTLGGAMGQIFGRPFDLLLGRKTYDIFAAHWPYVADPDGPIAGLFNQVTKYVASRSRPNLAWNNSQWLGEDAVASLKTLKGEDGPDLLLQGSSDFAQTLWKNGLVDEFRALTFPVVLGKGKRLFGDGAVPTGLKLIKSQSYPTGVSCELRTGRRGQDRRFHACRAERGGAGAAEKAELKGRPRVEQALRLARPLPSPASRESGPRRRGKRLR